jgi:hypothetical protein
MHFRTRVVSTFRPEIVPFDPRNPQPQSDTGQAKDDRARGNTMHNISRIRSIVFALVVLAMSAAAFAQIGISISFAPPELPVYEQPLCPGDGYLWTPGYWDYDNGFDDYYWVPGTWVMAPEPGLLWTPAYWGWSGGGYVFNEGYWGPQVGFYGGISYGYGYFGEGYQGGRWDNGHFFYNRSVNNVNVTEIHNVYNTTVIQSTTVNRVSFNGGTGGISARPTAHYEVAARAKHIPPVAVQTQHAQAARTNPQQRASVNQGKPAVAATPKPGAFTDRAVVPAKAAGAPYKPPANRAAAKPAANAPAAHPAEPAARPAEPQRATPSPAPAETKRAAPEPQHAQPAARPAEPERATPPPAAAETQRATPPPAPAETKRAAPEPQRAQPAARAPEEKKQPEEKKPPEEKPKE